MKAHYDFFFTFFNCQTNIVNFQVNSFTKASKNSNAKRKKKEGKEKNNKQNPQ